MGEPEIQFKKPEMVFIMQETTYVAAHVIAVAVLW
jgi:hypothetical protein